jgi:magnesium-transporting ATPase (P-type)
MFASIPIIWFGIYDKELCYDELYQEPKYYTQGIVGKLFHSGRFWKWVFYGILQGFVLFLFGYYAMNSPDYRGRTQDLWSVGSMIYAAIVTIVNLKILFSTNTHSFFSFFLFFVSIFSYWFVLFAMSHFYRFENFDNFNILLCDYWFYMASTLAFVLLLCLDIGVTKILFYFGLVKDGASIELHKIDEHLNKNLGDTNLLIDEKIKTICNI